MGFGELGLVPMLSKLNAAPDFTQNRVEVARGLPET
jgi:hypothetical protein